MYVFPPKAKRALLLLLERTIEMKCKQFPAKTFSPPRVQKCIESNLFAPADVSFLFFLLLSAKQGKNKNKSSDRNRVFPPKLHPNVSQVGWRGGANLLSVAPPFYREKKKKKTFLQMARSCRITCSNIKREADGVSLCVS